MPLPGNFFIITLTLPLLSTLYYSALFNLVKPLEVQCIQKMLYKIKL